MTDTREREITEKIAEAEIIRADDTREWVRGDSLTDAARRATTMLKDGDKVGSARVRQSYLHRFIETHLAKSGLSKMTATPHEYGTFLDAMATALAAYGREQRAEGYREGAEAMREQAELEAYRQKDMVRGAERIAQGIRALPLTTPPDGDAEEPA